MTGCSGPRGRKAPRLPSVGSWPAYIVRKLGRGGLVEQEQRPLATTGAGRRELHRARAGQRERDGAGLFLAGGEDPDLAGGLDGREGQRDADRRRLGGATNRDDRAVVVDRG